MHAEEDVMEQDLAQRLHNATKEQLVLLIQELASHSSTLSMEIEKTLASISTRPPDQSSIDEEFTADTLVLHRPLPSSSTLPFNLEIYRQRLTDYPLRLQQGASPQDIFDDLIVLLQEAEFRADQYDYQQALTIYGLVIDARLALQHLILLPIFDRSIDEFMPVLAMLLSEASSLILSDENSSADDPTPSGIHTDTLSLVGGLHSEPSPLLPSDKRRLWLERLFSLWLRRLDDHYSQENLPDIILEVAWNEDVPLLRSFIEKELHQQPATPHSNIVDFSLQSRTRILEKFLRELPSA